jgi:hypothetical protein
MKLAGLASAIVLGSLAAAPVVQPTTSHAADECLSGPKGAAPKGSHWYYRVDRATRKNCWYVRAERKQGPATNSSATLTLPPAETPLQPSVANARAEADPGTVGQPGGAAPEPAPFTGGASISDPGASATDESGSTVASRWLDQPTQISSTPGPATPAASDAMPNSAAPSAPPVAAELRSTSSSAAFPPLLLVIVGALAIAAGVTGVIVRSGRAARDEPDRFRPEQPAPWDVMDIGATIRSPPLATEAVIAQSEPARDWHEAVIPDEIVRLLSTLSKEAPA